MATQSSKNGKAKTQAKPATKAAAAEKSQVQAVLQTAVDVPVGAVLTVGDRVTELVEPWTDRAKAQKRVKGYRTQLRKSLKRTERRGTTARRRATAEAERRVRRAIGERTSRAQEFVGTVSDQLAALR